MNAFATNGDIIRRLVLLNSLNLTNIKRIFDENSYYNKFIINHCNIMISL